MPHPSSRPAYIALLSILMVTAIAASTVLILFTTSVNQVQNVADTEKGLVALMAANSCAERALEYVREAGGSATDSAIITAVGTQTVGEGTCSIPSVIVASPLYTLKAQGTMSDGSGTVDKFVQVKFTASADAAISLISWSELAS